MADSEIIVDIVNYCVKINANLLKERDIEINPTVDTTNRVDTDVVMQENVPLRVSDQLGSTSLADLILSQVEIQKTTWKPDSTKIMRQFQDFKRLDKIFVENSTFPMADSEIIVDISKNFLKERDIEINPTVDTTNRGCGCCHVVNCPPGSLGSTREYIPCGSYSFSGVNSNDHSET